MQLLSLTGKCQDSFTFPNLYQEKLKQAAHRRLKLLSIQMAQEQKKRSFSLKLLTERLRSWFVQALLMSQNAYFWNASLILETYTLVYKPKTEQCTLKIKWEHLLSSMWLIMIKISQFSQWKAKFKVILKRHSKFLTSQLLLRRSKLKLLLTLEVVNLWKFQ